jgi:predicted transcriptional regulator of viral defense system
MHNTKKERLLPEIEKLMKENGGIVKAAQLYPLGLTYRSVQGLVTDGVLDRVKSGYYAMNYREKQEDSIIYGMFPDGILTMDTALYYYGYIKERPFTWSIAISKNTSKSRFKVDYPVIRPYYSEPEVLELGVAEIPFAEGTMKIYEKERLICDCLKYEERLEHDVLKQALRSYIEEPVKDIAKLLEYARERKVVAKVQSRIGVWL